ISGIGRLETRAYTEQRRLPHAVRPNEPDAIAMREPKGDVAEDKALAETLRDRLDRENAHARGTRWQRGQWNVPRPPTTERTIAAARSEPAWRSGWIRARQSASMA